MSTAVDWVMTVIGGMYVDAYLLAALMLVFLVSVVFMANSLALQLMRRGSSPAIWHSEPVSIQVTRPTWQGLQVARPPRVGGVALSRLGRAAPHWAWVHLPHRRGPMPPPPP
jgi:hypothetical protein